MRVTWPHRAHLGEPSGYNRRDPVVNLAAVVLSMPRRLTLGLGFHLSLSRCPPLKRIKIGPLGPEREQRGDF